MAFRIPCGRTLSKRRPARHVRLLYTRCADRIRLWMNMIVTRTEDHETLDETVAGRNVNLSDLDGGPEVGNRGRGLFSDSLHIRFVRPARANVDSAHVLKPDFPNAHDRRFRRPPKEECACISDGSRNIRLGHWAVFPQCAFGVPGLQSHASKSFIYIERHSFRHHTPSQSSE